MPRHAILRTDGGVGVMEIFDADATPDTEIAKWRPEQQTTVTGHHALGDTPLPSRRWREAWVSDGAAIVVDLARARAIKRRELLAARDVVIDAVSKSADAADDNGDGPGVAKAKQKRKRLRNADAVIDAALASAATLTAIDAVTHPDLV